MKTTRIHANFEVDVDRLNLDAFTLRNHAVPANRKGEIITSHVNSIESFARHEPSFNNWGIGQHAPRALFVADYVNLMFFEAYRRREVLGHEEVADLYQFHTQQERHGQAMSASALGYTALSTIVFAVDKITGQADPRGLSAYTCTNINQGGHILLAS